MPGTRARSALAGTRFADVRWVDETASTNADVLALARHGAAEGVVLVADHQTAGRGRQGRTWTAPPGASLLVTVLLRPPVALTAVVTMAAGLAAAEAVEAETGCGPRLKWPNDLVWPGDGTGEDRKLAGLLAEAEWPPGVDASGGWRAPASSERTSVALGMGLNVNWPPSTSGGLAQRLADALPAGLVDEVEAELAGRAVAVTEIAGHPVDRVDLLVGWLRRLDARYGALVASGDTAALVADWRGRSATLGRRVRVDLGRQEVVGTAVDVTATGALLVETDSGERHTIAVGDVIHLRNA